MLGGLASGGGWKQAVRGTDGAAASDVARHALGNIYERKAKESGPVAAELRAFLSTVTPEQAKVAGVSAKDLQGLGIKPDQAQRIHMRLIAATHDPETRCPASGFEFIGRARSSGRVVAHRNCNAANAIQTGGGAEGGGG